MSPMPTPTTPNEMKIINVVFAFAIIKKPIRGTKLFKNKARLRPKKSNINPDVRLPTGFRINKIPAAIGNEKKN